MPREDSTSRGETTRLLGAFSRRRSERAPVLVGLSGFADAASFEAREPDWDAKGFSDVESAAVEARRWIDHQGSDASVEIIRIRGRVGHVVLLVTQSGSERIR